MATRDELVAALSRRYGESGREEKTRILDEFVAVTGYHRLTVFAPGAPARDNYIEVADQSDQVLLFWESDGTVIVIDRSIFRHFTEAMGHTMADVALHDLFPPSTEFRVGFKDGALRDSFNTGLAEFCRSGEYARLLDRFGVVMQESVCKN